MRFLVLCLTVAAIPAQLCAGAWARDKGATFLSFGATFSAPYDAPGQDHRLYNQLYIEHGLGRDITLGFDAGMDMHSDYSAVVFLRRPIDLGSRSKFAVQAGLGSASSGGQTGYVLHVGASWGRGLDTRLGSGWLAVDAKADYRLEQAELGVTTDFTLGLKPGDRTKLIIQLQTGRYPGSDAYIRLAPAYVREIAPGRHIELGAQLGLVGDRRAGLKLGSWLEF